MAYGGASEVSAIGSTIARVLIALALIVQIWAPVGSSVAMIRAAVDPLLDSVVCVHDQDGSDSRNRTDPLLQHHGDPCGLCQLVAGAGFAPPPEAPALNIPDGRPRLTDWAIRVEFVAAARLLDQIRGRAPPTLS